ncbi:unnamed protein product [Sphagnum balticum]
MATKIQQQGIVTTTDCSNRGAANSVCLPLTSQIYDTQNSQTLATSIANGQLGGAGGSSGIELLTNPNFENGAITNGWSTSGGTAALVASGSTGFLFGNYSASWTASASSQTFKSTAVALNGLAGGNCSASLYYTYGGTSGDYLFEAIDGSSNVLASLSLPAQSSAAQKTITWACNSSTSATVQWVLKSNVASPSIIYFDNAHLGSNTNIGTVQQAQFIGDVIITGCASNWSTAATSISDYGTQTGCTYTTTGSLGAPSTNLPGFSLSGGAGTYVVVYGGEAGNNSSTGGNVFFQLYDGTNSSLETLVNAVGTGVSGAFVGNLTFHITESAPFSSKQFRVRGYVASTESNAIWGTTATPGVFHVYYYPTSAQSVFAANGAAANWSGGSSKMGTTTATAPSDPSSVSALKMNLKLVTTSSQLYGIFGEVYALSGGPRLWVSLEHAYADGGAWVPKLARGKTYTCRRGTGPLPGGLWKLESGMVIDTFEVMDVPSFQGAPVSDLLAFHPGNFNNSSRGCACIGMTANLGMKMIQESDIAFNQFLDMQKGLGQYELTVV